MHRFEMAIQVHTVHARRQRMWNCSMWINKCITVIIPLCIFFFFSYYLLFRFLFICNKFDYAKILYNIHRHHLYHLSFVICLGVWLLASFTPFNGDYSCVKLSASDRRYTPYLIKWIHSVQLAEWNESHYVDRFSNNRFTLR